MRNSGCSAPGAARVQLDIGGHKYDFTKNDEGMWSVVTPPLVVGFHYYAIVVDGVSVAIRPARASLVSAK